MEPNEHKYPLLFKTNFIIKYFSYLGDFNVNFSIAHYI